MRQDPIVDEVRRIRAEHERRFNDDLHAICEDFRRRQASSGHGVVSRPPRRPVPHVAKPGTASGGIGASEALLIK